MPEQLLDDAEVRAAFEQMRRERVTERVGRDPERQSGELTQPVEAIAKAANPEWIAAVVQEDRRRLSRRRRQPRNEQRTTVRQVRIQGGAGGSTEEADPLLPALAEDPELAAPQIQGGKVGSGELADPETGGVGGLHDGAIAKGDRDPQRAGGPLPRPLAASTASSRRSTSSTSRTRGRRRGRRGVAIAPHGSPGASPSRAANR